MITKKQDAGVSKLTTVSCFHYWAFMCLFLKSVPISQHDGHVVIFGKHELGFGV